jgi:serine/threonine-protein kinase
VDARSDLYSTGCLLYELLTGRPPFLGDSPVAIAYQHVRENPVPPSRVDPEAPQWADAIVLRAMAKDPRDRYQSAAEMRQDIQRALQGVPVAAPPTSAHGSAQRMGLAAAMAGMPLGAMPSYLYGRDDRYLPERRWLPIVLWTAGILLVLGVVGGVAYAILSGGDYARAVPQVNRLTLAKAEHEITAAGLKYTVHKEPSATVPANIVLGTSPPNGNVLPTGSQVALVVSTGRKMVAVPYVTNDSFQIAVVKLNNAGFTNILEVSFTNPHLANGTVVLQDPSAGQPVPTSTQIRLTVVKN